jgi:tetratricopeptide (TPR) repeat protein
MLAAAAAACLATAARSAPPAATVSSYPPDRPLTPIEIVREARDFEDHNAYPKALVSWRRLRALAPLDGDLELATALDEARAGQIDSAAARLADRVLSDAAMDTLPVSRYRSYAAGRESLYVNGRFDGWHWYVWRARAEVAMAHARWDEATQAARRCVAARPVAGKEWLLLAVCAGRAGFADEARAAAQKATVLDATLPEAHYLAGLWAWRDGRRPEAQAFFRAALTADSTMSPAALALVRMRLAGSGPDSLPTAFLTGKRAAGLLTSASGPKLEEFLQLEQVQILAHRQDPVLPDSLKTRLLSQRFLVWLLVDDEGHVVLNDLPWSTADGYPAPVLADLLKNLAAWRFLPGKLEGMPRASWVDIQYAFPR